MSDLNSFAELIRKGKEAKQLQEAAELERKKKEVGPLLSDLFKTVSKAKVVEAKKAKILDTVDEIKTSLESVVSEDDVSEIVKQSESVIEKKLANMVKKLQDDITNLKKHVDSKPSGIIGTSGGGEVRVLRMDDVDKTGLQDGAVMTYSATLNKLVFTMPTNTPTITDEEMPYSKRIDFISDDVFYRGEAVVGASESAPVWRIRRITLGLDSDVTEVWAEGISSYTLVWANRATYIYK